MNGPKYDGVLGPHREKNKKREREKRNYVNKVIIIQE